MSAPPLQQQKDSAGPSLVWVQIQRSKWNNGWKILWLSHKDVFKKTSSHMRRHTSSLTSLVLDLLLTAVTVAHVTLRWAWFCQSAVWSIRIHWTRTKPGVTGPHTGSILIPSFSQQLLNSSSETPTAFIRCDDDHFCLGKKEKNQTFSSLLFLFIVCLSDTDKLKYGLHVIRIRSSDHKK